MRTLVAVALAAAFTFAGSGMALAAEESKHCAAEDAINVLTCVHVHDIDIFDGRDGNDDRDSGRLLFIL